MEFLFLIILAISLLILVHSGQYRSHESKTFSGILLPIFLSVGLYGCGMSNEEIEGTVKTSMQKEFDSNEQSKTWNLNVSNIKVAKQKDNQYQGIATVIRDGKSLTIPVQIALNDSNVSWEAPSDVFWQLAPELMFLQSMEGRWAQKGFFLDVFVENGNLVILNDKGHPDLLTPIGEFDSDNKLLRFKVNSFSEYPSNDAVLYQAAKLVCPEFAYLANLAELTGEFTAVTFRR